MKMAMLHTEKGSNTTRKGKVPSVQGAETRISNGLPPFHALDAVKAASIAGNAL